MVAVAVDESRTPSLEKGGSAALGPEFSLSYLVDKIHHVRIARPEKSAIVVSLATEVEGEDARFPLGWTIYRHAGCKRGVLWKYTFYFELDESESCSDVHGLSPPIIFVGINPLVLSICKSLLISLRFAYFLPPFT